MVVTAPKNTLSGKNDIKLSKALMYKLQKKAPYLYVVRDDCTGMSKKGRLIKKNAVLDNLLERYPLLCECRDSIENAYLKLEQVYRDGGRLYIAGNGGSAADSGHIAGELVKSYVLSPRNASPFPANAFRDWEKIYCPSISFVTAVMTVVSAYFKKAKCF